MSLKLRNGECVCNITGVSMGSPAFDMLPNKPVKRLTTNSTNDSLLFRDSLIYLPLMHI